MQYEEFLHPADEETNREKAMAAFAALSDEEKAKLRAPHDWPAIMLVGFMDQELSGLIQHAVQIQDKLPEDVQLMFTILIGNQLKKLHKNFEIIKPVLQKVGKEDFEKDCTNRQQGS